MTILRPLAIAMAATFVLAIQPATAQELTGTLKKVKDTGVITVGYRDSSVPFSYLDDNQKPIGYAMDLCYRIVDAVKQDLKMKTVQIKLVPVTSATRIPLIANGTVDLVCGSATNNVERQKLVSFTIAHFLTATRWVSKKSSNIGPLSSLKGQNVASTAGTTNIKQLVEANAAQHLDMNVMAAKDHAEAFLLVETDRAKAFVMDDILLAGLVANAKDPSQFVISDDTLSKPEPYGIILRKGDPAFKKVVDAAMTKIYTSGDVVPIYNKWFMSPIPPKGVNLHFPMTAAMKKLIAHPIDSPNPADY